MPLFDDLTPEAFEELKDMSHDIDMKKQQTEERLKEAREISAYYEEFIKGNEMKKLFKDTAKIGSCIAAFVSPFFGSSRMMYVFGSAVAVGLGSAALDTKDTMIEKARSKSLQRDMVIGESLKERYASLGIEVDFLTQKIDSNNYFSLLHRESRLYSKVSSFADIKNTKESLDAEFDMFESHSTSNLQSMRRMMRRLEE